MAKVIRQQRLPILVAGLALGALVMSIVSPATATHQPADKVAVASSTMEKMTTPVVEGAESVEVDLFGSDEDPILMKTASPTDLVFSVNAECALTTDVTTQITGQGTDESEAVASMKVWVEVDGERVGVTGADEDGEVVFCNRAFRNRFTQTDDDEDNHTFEQFLRTRATHSFEWIKLNMGSDVHEIVVKAQLESNVTGVGTAQALVGKRTLVITPGKYANDVEI